MSLTRRNDILSHLFFESEAYKKFEDIEKLVESGVSLSAIPIQPLFVSLQQAMPDQVAQILPRLSSEQRQALRDMDFWTKDQLEPKVMNYWLEVYSKCPDEETILEYLQSEDFLLTIKSQFNVMTFDVEDPMYPDHDRYFLTEDNLLLIEYDEEFTLVQELKEHIRRLYGELGVENAYAFLFKMVVDSFSIMEEENYRLKTERLRDYGFVDYFEALAYQSLFTSEAEILDSLHKLNPQTPTLDDETLNQSLHATSLLPYQSGLGQMRDYLAKLENEKRLQYLQFDFIKLVNAQMTLEGALKDGSVAMNRVGLKTRYQLELGFDYIVKDLADHEVLSLLEKLSFKDLYKIGHSLIEIHRKKLKKTIAASSFDKDEFSYFLGMYWNALIENSFEDIPKYKFDGSTKAQEIHSYEIFKHWKKSLQTLMESLPYVEKFFTTLTKLKESSQLNDQFYLNYEVDNIDFEAIILSSLINFALVDSKEPTSGKMGMTVNELKNFYHLYFNKVGEEYLVKGLEDLILAKKLHLFCESFGLDKISNFEQYLYQILVEQLNGYEIDQMSIDDFKHVGGPILLNTTEH